MASNCFGSIFRITTWGESHGKAIGVVIDGCPAGLEIFQDELLQELLKRAPGQTAFTSPRKENEIVEILSGVYQGKTTGAPISIIIYNKDVDSSKYEPIKDIYRPGHANFTYLHKYGIFDPMGGGRSSARETACRVAAGYVAKKLLKKFDIEVLAYLSDVGHINSRSKDSALALLKNARDQDIIFCPDPDASIDMQKLLLELKEVGNSIGGSVSFLAEGLPIGLGDPIYEKLEAKLASAFLSIPASKSFEMGFLQEALSFKGSEFNDCYEIHEDKVTLSSNHSGGTLGGISTGMPLFGQVSFKPTSSIKLKQESVTVDKLKTSFILPEGSRHDPCVAIRAVFVVEAMLALVLADAILMNRSSKL
jgi:chorismate synthase